MRIALFAALIAFSQFTFALQTGELARALVNGPRDTNEYMGVTPKGISCGASLSIRDGKLEGFATWGDTAAGVKADLASGVKVLSNQNGVTTLQVSHFDEPSMTMTLTVKNRAVTSMLIEGDDPILFIPRRFHVACNQLEQFIPKPPPAR